VDLDDAIRTHMRWRLNLSAYLRRVDGSLRPELVGMDSQCQLGMWLHDPGNSLKGSGIHRELLHEHAEFHQEAAVLVARANRGERVDGEASLGATSPYAQRSSRLVSLIATLRRLSPPGRET
jgi:hypothetical protein